MEGQFTGFCGSIGMCDSTGKRKQITEGIERDREG
jgi:hypothetical protein